MKKRMSSRVIFPLISHIFLFILILVSTMPNARQNLSPASMYIAFSLLEAIYLLRCRFYPEKIHSSSVLVSVFWIASTILLLLTTKYNLLHPVLCPSPEEVWDVFRTQYSTILSGIASSLSLLAVSLTLGLTTGVIFGLTIGSSHSLAGIFMPIAQVLTPIPPVIYAPYLVALMPSFRSASRLIIFLGVFNPIFLRMIICAQNMDQRILDIAATLEVKGMALVFRVFLPFVLPNIISNLKVVLSTSITLLLFAEMIGATSGMGYYIVNNIHYANYANVIAGIIVVAVVIIVLNRIIDQVRKNYFHWYKAGADNI